MEGASQWHSGNSTKLLVLILWRGKLAWFEENLNRLGTGAFEVTSRRLPFERVAAAMPKTIFDMEFFMADVRP
jgi:hypothetical protein